MRGQGCRRAVSGGGDRLARRVRSYVTGGEQALALGPHPDVRGDASMLVQGNGPVEDLGVRETTDVREDPRNGKGRRVPRHEVAHADAVDLPVPEDLLEDRPVPDLDVRALPHATAVRLLPREGLVGVNEDHPHVVSYELERLDERRVTVTTHCDQPAPVQRTVAAGARAESPALERLLVRHAELAGPRPGGDDDGGRADLTGIGDDVPVAAARFDAPHLAQLERAAGLDDLLLHTRAELEAWDSFRKTGKVLDPLRVQDRAARAEMVEQDRAPAVTRGEERSGETGRPSARYRDLVVRHALVLPLCDVLSSMPAIVAPPTDYAGGRAIVKRRRRVGTSPLPELVRATCAPDGYNPCVAPRSVRLSSPERVLFPDEGITKQDVFEYYRAIAPVLVPHLRNRPFTMKRFPYGATGDVYFQKQAPKGMPSWIPTRTFRTYPREGGSRLVDFPLLNSPEAVLWMVQMNCIDMNAWYSRVDKPDRPDFVLFDLDPPEGGFTLAVRVAHLIREELERAGLESYVKTSGADGMHVLVPIARRATYEQTYAFAERVARGLEERHPGLVTTEWLKRKREGVSSTTVRTRGERRSPRSTPCGRSRVRRSRRRFAGTS